MPMPSRDSKSSLPLSVSRPLALLSFLALLTPVTAGARKPALPQHPCLAAARLDFGEERLGTRAESSLTLRNRCPRPITVWKVESGSPAFSVALAAPLRIPGRSTRPLPVTFAPAVAGPVRATLTLSTEPFRRNAYAVVTGRGVPAPEPSLAVAPASVSLELGTAVTDTFRLAVTNRGTSPRAEILVDAIGAQAPRPARGWRVLYLNTVLSQPGDDDFTAILDSLPGVDTAVRWFGGDSLPTVARLLGYDVVVVASDRPWHDPVQAGEALAGYLEAGGKVLLTAGALQSSGNPLSGRILDYSPVGPGQESPGGSSDLLAPHAITAGVGAFSSQGVLQVTDTPGQGAGIPLGRYDNGYLVGAYHPDKPLVFLNLRRGFSGDVPRLLANSLDYLGGMMAWATPRPPFDPVIFVVPDGETRELAVAVNTHRLAPGTYSGAIRLRNVSATGSAPVDVPVELSVSSRGSLVVAPESVAATIPRGWGASETLQVANLGASSLRLSLRPVVDTAEGRPSSGPEEMDILYLHGAGGSLDGDSLLPALLALPRVRSLTGFLASDSLPPLAYLLGFDAVLVASSGPWADAAALGDRLADYVDAGGRICLMHPALIRQADRPGHGLAGRITEAEYLPFTPGPGIRGGYVDRFTDNPLTEGVRAETHFHSDSVMELRSFQGEGHFLGWYFNGSMVGAYGYRKAVVFLNVQPVQGSHDLVETVKLLDNTFRFLARFYDWFAPERSVLELAPGESAEVRLYFGAPFSPGLGTYSGRLEIRVEGAGSGELVTVPVSLAVEPNPAASSSP